MEGFWKTAVKVTGPVAVVALVATVLIENIYQDTIVAQFGSENVFYVTMALITLVAIALLLSIILHRRPESLESRNSASKEKRVAKISKSKIGGDFVMGDKHVNTDRKRDEQS